jgi:N6-adenosine-specific RNA methylase IME4
LRRGSIRKERANDDKPFEGGILGAGEQIDAIPGDELLAFAGSKRFATVLADPPWRFSNRTGKIAPEHRRLSRYSTMAVEDIAALPVAKILKPTAHLYLWVPNALLPHGLEVLAAWGFYYKTVIIWHKLRKDGGSDGRGVGFYFRNVTETLLFGVRGKNARTLVPGRTQVNYIGTRKREHSRKPDEQYKLIENCSPGPFLEMFGRGVRPNWSVWGNQADEQYEPTWKTYAHNSAAERRLSDSDKSLQFAFLLPKPMVRQE